MQDSQSMSLEITFGPYILRELIWYKPCHTLIHDFRLVIYTLDRQERFP
jgi:hypothetical protein